MKTTKKIFALLLALAMVMSMAVTAFADDAAAVAATSLTDTGILTIKNATAGYNYNFYRILDLAEISSDGKPVYAMREDGLWDAFFENGNFGEKAFEVSEGYVREIKLIDGKEWTAQELAEAVVAFANANSIERDFGTKMTTSGDYRSGTPRQFGYYVMATDRVGTTETSVKYTAFVLMVPELPIEEKNLLNPTIEKFVQEDSEAGAGDDGWKDDDKNEYNVAEIEQPVKFKVVVHLKSGSDLYVIRDELSDKFEGLANLEMEYSGGGTVDSTRVDVETTDNSFTITLKDTFRKNIEDGTTLTIRYTAKLKDDAIIGHDGNKNTAYLDYTDVVTKERATASDETYTKTYKLHVKKVDETGAPLEGAAFELHHAVDGSVIHVTNESGSNVYTVTADQSAGTLMAATGENCEFTVNGLDTVDHYILKEMNVPSGYVKMDDTTIEINPADTENFVNDTYTITVENLPGVQMPTTGGMGTTIFYAIGGLMTAAALILLITKKRMAA